MKDKTVASILALLLGGLGIHKFYLGNWIGLAYLFFCWTFIPAIIGFIEGIVYLTMPQDEWDMKYNSQKIDNLRKGDVAIELEKLYSLKEKGIISEDEFNAKKQQLLK